jgi:TolB protein
MNLKKTFRQSQCLFTLLFSFCINTICAGEDMDPIVVGLATDNPLEPLYLVPIISDQSDFDTAYIQKLDQILRFDIQHNGWTYLAKRDGISDNKVNGGLFEDIGELSFWQKSRVSYVVKPSIKDKSLMAMILNVSGSSLKKIDKISLTGDLNQDRRSIHQLSDSITRALFAKEGIALTKILFTLKSKPSQAKWVSEVWECDYDGGNPRQITKMDSYCVTPVYVPPKEGCATGNILYTSYQIGQPKIYIASLKEGKGQRLTTLRGNQLMPAISRQRDKVVFISDVTGNPDLFLQSFSPETGVTGKPQQIFSAKQATQGSPALSPDGNRVVFVSNKDGSARIYLIDIPKPGALLQDIKAQLISKRNRDNSAPSWSPDGKKLAYCANSNGFRQIWIYDFASKEEKPLTQGSGHKENPSWAPDSLHIVYNSADANQSELYLINLNEMESTKIPLLEGEKRFPCWEPK